MGVILKYVKLNQNGQIKILSESSTLVLWVSPAAGNVGSYNGNDPFSLNCTVSVINGYGPTVFSVVSGTLPAGTTLNTSTGIISGTLGNTTTTYNFTIRATNNNAYDERTFSASVTRIAAVNWVSPAAGSLGSFNGGDSFVFSPIIDVAFGSGSTVYSIQSGTIPLGTSFNTSTGAITGILDAAPYDDLPEIYNFTIRATNNGLYEDRSFTTSVAEVTLVSWNSPVAGPLGASAGGSSFSFIANTTVIDPVGSTAYSVVAGTLPNGTSLNAATGAITGTLLNVAAPYSFTIRATNNGVSADRAFTGTVTGTTVITWNSPAAGALGTFDGGSYFSLEAPNITVTYPSGSTEYYAIGALPAGTTINSSTGVVSGTLTNAASSFSFTIRATNNGVVSDRAFTGSVAPITVVTWNSPTAGVFGSFFGNSSFSLISRITVVNSVGSTVYSISSGALPAGTSINSSTGVITGTLDNADSNYAFTIRATNNSASSDRSFTGSVAAVSVNWVSPTAGPQGESAGATAYTFTSNVAVTSGIGSVGSFAFNGSSRLSAPGNLITGNFTIESWIYPTSGASGIIFSDGTFNNGTSLTLYLGNGGLYVNTATNGETPVYNAGLVPLNTWSHIAWERNNGANTIYVNGTSVATFYYLFHVFATNSLAIGSSTSGQYPFIGNMSGIRLVTSAVYNGNFAAPTSPPVAITNTVLLLKSATSSTLLTDASGLNTSVTNFGTTWSSRAPFNQIVYSITSGAVPAGTTLDTATGIISGTLTNITAAYSFTVRATVNGISDDRSFTGTVAISTTYVVSPNITSVNEGNAVIYTVTTADVADGTTLYWTNNGTTSAADFSDSNNSGSFTITSNTGTFTRTLSADLTTEGSETIIAQVRTVSTSGTVVATANTVTVNDTSVTPPFTYAITPNVTSAIEGSTVAYTVTTTGVSDGTSLYWTNNGTTAPADFTEGGSIAFNGSSISNGGSNQYLTAPANAGYSFGTGDFTVEAWVYAKSTDATYGKVILDSRPASTNGSYWNITLGTAGKFGFGGGAIGGITDTVTASLNTWYHVAATRQGSAIKLFVNGRLAGSMTSAATADSSGIFIGVNAFSGIAINSYWHGYMTNIRIVKGTAVYTSAFTPSTTPLSAITNTSLLLRASSSATVRTDSSTNALTISNSGTTFDNTNPFAGGSISLNGTSQYLSYASNSAHDIAGSDFTIEFFAKLNATSGSMISKYGSLLNGGGAAGETAGGYGWLVQYTASALRFITGTGGDQVMSFAWTPATNTWYHIAISRSGTSVKAFVNGTQIGTTATQTIPTYNSANQLQIGKTHTTSEYFNGNITNVRLIKGTALYTANFTAPISELTAVTNTTMLLKSASSTGMLIDSSTNGFTFTNNGTAIWSPLSAVSSALDSASVSVYSNTAIITRTLFNDLVNGEGSESIILNVRTGSTSGTVVATANTVTVNDKNGALLYMNVDSSLSDLIVPSRVFTNTGTSINTSIKKFGAGSVSFNGSQYFTTPNTSDFNLSSQTAWTVEAWLYRTSNNGGHFLMTGTGSVAIHWRMWTSGTEVAMGFSNGGWSNDYAYTTSGATFSSNAWNHVAAVRNGSELKIFVNGILAGTFTPTFGSGATGSLMMGAYILTSQGPNYIGYMDDICISNIAKYTANFTPPTASLF